MQEVQLQVLSGGNLSHFSVDSWVAESGQVAVEFCTGCQSKCFHFDLFIVLVFLLLSHPRFFLPVSQDLLYVI